LQTLQLLSDTTWARMLFFGNVPEIFTNPVFTGVIKTSGYTVANLPSGSVGMTAYVTDATTPTWNSALTGGGLVTCGAFHNGIQWVAR
jgi:hypothetical protein